jgi:TatD DNase family protein
VRPRLEPAAAGAGVGAPAGSPVVFTDIAVNLTDPMFQGEYRGKTLHPPDLISVLRRAVAANVRRIVITGTDLEDSRRALALAREVNRSGAVPGLRLFSTVGVHPTRTADLEPPASARDVEAALLALARDGMADGTVVCIGEAGLDMERLHFSPADVQARHFPMHLRLARATGLPLFLHDRATGGGLLRLIAAGGGLPPAGGVVHSFTGSGEDVAAYCALPNLFIGLNGCGLKTEANLQAAARIPLARLLLETDAPWCGVRGSSAAAPLLKARRAPAVDPKKWAEGAVVKDRNEPAEVALVAEAVAALVGRSVEDVAAAAERNADALLFTRR